MEFFFRFVSFVFKHIQPVTNRNIQSIIKEAQSVTTLILYSFLRKEIYCHETLADIKIERATITTLPPPEVYTEFHSLSFTQETFKQE